MTTFENFRKGGSKDDPIAPGKAKRQVGVTTALVERANADRAQLESQENVDFSAAIASCEAEIGPLEADSYEISGRIAAEEASLTVDRGSMSHAAACEGSVN